MTYDYFYGQQAEMFAFYRVPKVLFTEDCFWNVSTDAKLLYGILLDRMNLSARNGWLDEEGRVYIIFTIEEIKGALGCAEKKAVKLLDELEKKCGLIERKRQGLGKPNLIYVKNFISGSVERQFLNCQKDNSGVVKNTIQELSKGQGNNTDIKYIDLSDIDPFFPSCFCGKEADGTDEFTRYYQYFYEQLSMDYLKQDYPYDHEILDLILHLIVEVMCSNRKQIRIASDDKPIEIVKSSFMKLDSEHIRFVMSSFKENTNALNLSQTKLYNQFYKQQLVNHLEQFGAEDIKVLLTLDPKPMKPQLFDELAVELKKYNSENATRLIHPIKHVNLTFEQLVDAMEDIVDDRDTEIIAVLDDFKKYCFDEKLIPDGYKWMRAIVAGTTFQDNMDLDLFYDQESRKFSEHGYIGLYKDKSIRAIGKLKKTIIAVENNGNMTYRAESGAEPTADEIERINEAIRRADHYGYNLRTISHRYFIVEKFYPIDFRKSSKNPIQKSKFFNLADMFGYKTMPNTDVIANDLNGRTWEEF